MAETMWCKCCGDEVQDDGDYGREMCEFCVWWQSEGNLRSVAREISEHHAAVFERLGDE